MSEDDWRLSRISDQNRFRHVETSMRVFDTIHTVYSLSEKQKLTLYEFQLTVPRSLPAATLFHQQELELVLVANVARVANVECFQSSHTALHTLGPPQSTDFGRQYSQF